MIRVGSVPHSWLFKQGYCVIHHCGFGTSASSMIYGIPSIPIPHVLDQFAFADRLYKLNVSVEPIKASELSEEKMISAINELKKNYDKLHDCVADLSKKMYLVENFGFMKGNIFSGTEKECQQEIEKKVSKGCDRSNYFISINRFE